MALELEMIRDKTGTFFISVYQRDGSTAQSLVGATLYFHAALDGILAIDKSSPSSGITIQNSAGGADCATLTITPADTLPLEAETEYSVPCELIFGATDGSFYTLDYGSLIVRPNVGTP